jgi:peptide/nickel transport system permease protein
VSRWSWLLCALVLLGALAAPYDPSAQHRDDAFHPPGSAYLLGTDEFGRDQLSRLLYAGRLSLGCALLATAVSLGLAVLVGAASGFFGRRWDEVLMRCTELFLALPWLYLLLAVRGALPLDLAPEAVFLLLSVGIGALGWPRPARLVRGIVLAAKEREYVYSARGFGAPSWYLLWRHILPETKSVLWTQAGILIPQFILAEATLSFLGLGVAEPAASWGNLLSSLRDLHVLTTYWWMSLPSLFLLLFLLAWNALTAEENKV